MHSRTDLREILYSIAGKDNVYYQPPSNTRMTYPCIRYKRSKIQNDYADNKVYIQHYRYEITVMDKNPDSKIADAVSKIPRCQYINEYVVENIHHTIFQIFY